MREPYDATVLIVDDDPTTISVIIKSLEGLCRLQVTTRSEEVLGLIKSAPPDLLLSDVNMPQLDGYTLLRTINESPDLPQVPTIFLTSRSNHEDEELGLTLGAVDYVSKPINPSILRARVKSQLLLQLTIKREVESRQRADELLSVIFPSKIALELKELGKVEAKSHPSVAVLFCDVVGFTQYCHQRDATDVVERLDALFKRFEEISNHYQVEKIKTIGDCYMATSGLSEHPLNDHALYAASMAALEMCQVTPQVTPGWSARAGVYIGPLVSGIVGDQRYQFDVWGNTVNIASRLCGASSPGSLALIARDWLDFESVANSFGGSSIQGRSLGVRALKGLSEVEVYEVRTQSS